MQCSDNLQVSLLLYKPSDKTSSDPIDFWYEPATTAPSPLVGSPAVAEMFKKPKKRPKERTAPDEPSTGNWTLIDHIYIYIYIYIILMHLSTFLFFSSPRSRGLEAVRSEKMIGGRKGQDGVTTLSSP